MQYCMRRSRNASCSRATSRADDDMSLKGQVSRTSADFMDLKSFFSESYD